MNWKKVYFTIVMITFVMLVSCMKQETIEQPEETKLPVELNMSEITGKYTTEDLTDLGLWILTIEAEGIKGKIQEKTTYYFVLGTEVYEIRENPLNPAQLMVFLPETCDVKTIKDGKISITNMNSNSNSRVYDDISIEYVYITKADKLYEMTLINYIFLKKAPHAFVYDDKLIRPSHIKSSEGYAYVMKYYYDAKQVASEHKVNGAFEFLKSQLNHQSKLISPENPYRVKIEGGTLITYDPDNRDRVWQLGDMGMISVGSTYTYNITDNSGEMLLTLTIKEDNLPSKYKKTELYEIQFKDDATVCSFTNKGDGIFDCVIQYATTSNVDLTRNARFSEIAFSTTTDIRVKTGNEPYVLIITDTATVLKVASGTTVAQVKDYIEAVDQSEQNYSFETPDGDLTDVSTITKNGTITVLAEDGEPYETSFEMRINPNPFVKLECETNQNNARNTVSASWHDTIGDAITAGADGATITVWPGEYKEWLDLKTTTDNFHIKSTDPENEQIQKTTIINANGLNYSSSAARISNRPATTSGPAPAVYIANGQDEKTIIEGFTLTTRTVSESSGGAGIIIKNTTPEIRNNRIIENRTTNGGGVYIQTDTLSGTKVPYIHHNIIENNLATTAGGGLYVYTNSTAKIAENDIKDNRANTNGGGISVDDGGRIINANDEYWKPHLLKGTADNAAEVEGIAQTNTFSGNNINGDVDADSADIFFERTVSPEDHIVLHGGEKWARVYATLYDGDIARLFTDEASLTEVASTTYEVQGIQSRLSGDYVQIDWDQIQTGTTYYVTLQSTPALYAQSTKVATTALNGPATPVLTSPADNETGVTSSPTLEWEPAANAETYTIYFGETSGALKKVDEGITDTEYATSELERDTTYYWQVASVDTYGITSFSEERQFTTTDNPFSGGSGTLLLPYKIATPEQLDAVRDYLGTSGNSIYFEQINNVDLAGYGSGNWEPIGDGSKKFYSSYDGGGYEIQNLAINRPSENYIGLFGYIREATITNVILSDAMVTGNRYVGGLVGYNYEGTISGSSASCTVTAEWYVGGFVGHNYKATISESSASCTVTGEKFVGGFVGKNEEGTISESSASCTVTGEWCVGGFVGINDEGTINTSYSSCTVIGIKNVDGEDVGGFVGSNYKGTINDSYSNCTVSGDDDVGGFVGQNDGTISESSANCTVDGVEVAGGFVGKNNAGTISESSANCIVSGDTHVGGFVGNNYNATINDSYSNCPVNGNEKVGGFAGSNYGPINTSYSSGSVMGTTMVGGFVGGNFSGGIVDKCYWNKDTSGQGTSSGSVDSFGKSTADMKKQSTFVGWNFTNTWAINSSYPYLQWQQP